MDKLKLDPTAALMLLLERKSFKCKEVHDFIDHLDLSSGSDLQEECFDVCEWYEEMVLNRRYFISGFFEKSLNEVAKEHLIIILGAGKSPYSLELLKNYFQKINIILEIDIEGMNEKKELYDRYYPELSEKIKCINADIRSTSILSFLNSLLHEYYNDLPCIILLENIVCYLSQHDLQNIISSFRSSNKNNTFIIEYLLPSERISKERKAIPHKVFNTIKQTSGVTEIIPYTFENLFSVFKNLGGDVLKHNSLKDIELERTGSNKYFPKDEDGWIECSAWKV